MSERETFFNKPMNRRGAFRLFAGAGIAAAGAGALLAPPSTMAAGGPLEVITAVDVFGTPSVHSEYLGTLSVGELVNNWSTMDPEVVDGFRHVTTGHNYSGWVDDTALEPHDALPEDPVFNISRYVTVEEPLLVEPYGDVVATLVFGTQVETSTIRDGEFIYGRVWLEGGPVEGWVRNWILTPESARPFTVILPELEGWVPMMAEADDDSAVVAEIPVGAKVIDYDGIESDGYLGVESAFGSGWIRKEFLGVG